MARIRLISLAILAVFVVGAVASASASAASKGEFVNSGGKALTKGQFTATSATTQLETVAGTKVTCTADLALGLITSATGGEQTVHFTGCTSGGLSCKSTHPPAAKAGEIVVLTAILILKGSSTTDVVLNTILKEGTKTPGELEFECSGVIIKVKGSFYSSLITVPSGLKTLIAVSAAQTKGVQGVKENEAGNKAHLETSVNGKAFEESGQEGTETMHLLEEAQFT